MVEHIPNIWESVRHLLLTQYQDSENLKKLIKVFIDSLQEIEDSAERVRKFANIDIADGQWLDIIGAIKNVKRTPGEDDTSYKNRLVSSFVDKRKGTCSAVVESARMLSGDASPVYLDEAPATFMVYTPNGIQLKRETVQKMAPAGVLGLPAAALKLGNGCFLAMTSGETMLTAAIDDIDARWRGYCNDHEITMSDGGDECRISDGGDGYIYARETLFDCDSVSEE